MSDSAEMGKPETALYRACNAVFHADCLLDDEECVRIVRAVLTAIREPDEAMYDALCATDKLWRDQTSRSVWQTYIDALLAELERG